MTSEKEKKCCKIESELDCKATASLDAEIVDELMAEDKSLSELLDESQWESEGGAVTTPEEGDDNEETQE